MVEHRDPVAQFPALPVATAARVLENYDLQKVGQDRVAGLEADVLMLKPRDRLRFPQRLWAHRESGLLLRNDVLAPGGEVLESSAFVDVRLGAKVQPEQILKPMKQLDGFKVLRPQQVVQSVFSDGLAQVSVFIERYDAARHPKAMRTSAGASHTVMARRDDWWLTVVGEVPMATVQQFVSQLERKR